MKKILAIIPARGGSKGLPGKNIIDLGGKPMINWTIDAARNSKYISEIFVSTDDICIKNIVEQSGIYINKLRSKELSQDETHSIDVVLDILSSPEYSEFEFVCMLQPTSPLRTSNHIDEAFDMFFELKANSCVSVTENQYSPFWSFEIKGHTLINLFPGKSMPLRRQELPLTYSLNGAIYIAKIEWLFMNKSFVSDQTIGYIMDNRISIDIDNIDDLETAKSIINNFR